MGEMGSGGVTVIPVHKMIQFIDTRNTEVTKSMRTYRYIIACNIYQK